MKTLEIISKIASIIASGSIIIAIISYWENKNRNKVLTVVDQVSFFREKIIPECDKLVKLVRDIEANYIFSKIRLDSLKIEDIKDKFKDEIKKQVELLKKYKTNYTQVTILNLLEEISLKIKYTKTINHKALNSIKPIFVMFVEINAVVLMQERELITGNQIFSATLELYNKWKDEVDLSTPEERIKKISKYFN
ncbi:MAG: hypothetical protein WCI91_00045 [Candidatus Nomurabacteria bacterium]